MFSLTTSKLDSRLASTRLQLTKAAELNRETVARSEKHNACRYEKLEKLLRPEDGLSTNPWLDCRLPTTPPTRRTGSHKGRRAQNYRPAAACYSRG